MRVLVLLLMLGACATPSPRMLGAERHDITLDGMGFVVFHKHDQAEVVRLSFVARPDRGKIHALMRRAASRTTGCAVIPFSMTAKVPGDPGVAVFDLDCRSAIPRPDS